MQASKPSALFLISVVALGTAGQVHALKANQQGDPASIKAELSREGQIEIARAIYVLNYKTEDPAKMKSLRVQYTMNAEGTGYVLLSDNRDETKASKTFVYSKIINGSVYDPRTPSEVVPDGVLPKTSAEKGMEKCKRLVDSGAMKECRVLSSSLRKAFSFGDRIMLHGDLVVKQPDGSEKIDGKITVLANLNKPRSADEYGRSMLLYSDTDGVTTIDRTFVETVYTNKSVR